MGLGFCEGGELTAGLDGHHSGYVHSSNCLGLFLLRLFLLQLILLSWTSSVTEAQTMFCAHNLASLGLSRRFTATKLRVFLALPWRAPVLDIES